MFDERDASTATTTFTLNGAASSAADGAGIMQLGARFSSSSRPGPGLTGVHLLVRGHDHLYTSDAADRTAATREGYIDQGEQFWVATAHSCGSQVLRFTKDGVSRYAITSGDRERLASGGWINAGTAFRAKLLTSFQWQGGIGKGPLDRPPYNNPKSHAWKAFQGAASDADRRILYQLAATPSSIWLGPGDDMGDYVDKVTSAAAAMGQVPQFVLYAIPHRDCDGYAAGGYNDVASYRRWVDNIQAGLHGRPAIVIVEPDSIGWSCLPDQQQTERIAMLRYAMHTLSSDPDQWVYIHAGSSGLPPKTIAANLIKVGVEFARGFAVNVAGYDTTASEISYGKHLASALADAGVANKHFVVDTSRAGAGRPPKGSTGDVPQWCNPRGRAVGPRPTPVTGAAEVDALLWVKPPGETDGPCYPDDPPHGWFNSYALDLVRSGLQRQTIADIPTP